MPLLAVARPSGDQLTVDEIRSTLTRRFEASAYPPCPVDFASGYVGMCAAQSCGKCTPCRVGLPKLQALLERVLDGTAKERTITEIEELAEDIYLSADCAIGYDAASTAWRAVQGFREDFEAHVHTGQCGASAFTAIPCMRGCPARVDIPGYIALVAEGRYQDAIRLIRKDNPFPLACGLICEHPCEPECRRNMIDDAVNIRSIKRFAVDHSDNDYTPFHYEPTGKKVAVIGGGPAGMSAAYFLALMGHAPTVFEQRESLGGMMRYGIPAYRLPRERLQDEMDFLVKQGIEVKLNTSVPGDVSFDELRENYDAIYVAIGAHTDKKLGIDGENAEGVMSAVQILRAIGDGHHPDFTGKRVAVIGGGNVAMDCARSAVRLGADHVSIVYRRRIDDMTCQREEIDGAIAEGCELMELVAPLAIMTENDQVTGLQVQKQMISKVDRGRPAPVKANTEPEVLPFDVVLVAIGQDIEVDPFEGLGMHINRGMLVGDEFARVQGLEGVFVGGDCESGPATVIKAIAAGKAAARNIDDYLGFHHPIKQEVDVPTAAPGDKLPCGRSNAIERPVHDRVDDFDLMEQGLSVEEAMQEASRCLRCDHFGYGAFREGRQEEW